jgi:REP element-mobilizing transposase RayT
MRIARLTVPGVLYHVISRFVDREWLFGDDEERETYLRMFGAAVRKSDWNVVAYCLMSNHIHHGLIAGEEPMGSLFKRTHSPFARWMNKRHGRLGPIFADRAASWGMRREHEARTIAYIHNNPVRAGVVARAADSSWSSHRAYVGGPVPSWLSVAEARARAGIDADFDGFVETLVSDDEVQAMATIRRDARKRGAVEIATPSVAPLEVPLVVRPFACIRPAPREVLDAVANAVGLAVERFASRTLLTDCVSAKRVAVQTGTALGLTASDMATALGISRSAGSRLASTALDDFEHHQMMSALAVLTRVGRSAA